MKLKIYTLLLALSVTWSLQSCDNDDDGSIAVPAELQSAFSSKFPNAANVFVIEVEKQNQEVDLYYSADGTLIKSIVDTDDDNSEHLPVQLTEAMKNFINEKYPNARIMEVDVEDDRNDWDFGFTEVDIIHNGISKDVLFNQTGNWYSTSWEIRQNELPEAVNNTLNNQYGEYRFDEAEYIEKADGSIYYRIELEKGDVDKVVNIGENGTVLS